MSVAIDAQHPALEWLDARCSKIARMKLASVSYRGRDLVVTELAGGELVGIESLPGRPDAQSAPVDMLDVIRGGEPRNQEQGQAGGAAHLQLTCSYSLRRHKRHKNHPQITQID